MNSILFRILLLPLALLMGEFVGAQTVQWMQTEIWSNSNYGLSVGTDAAGYVYFSGTYSGTPTGGFLSKYDAQGNHLWSDTSVHALFNDAATDSAGNTYTAGSIICKFNTNGNFLWSKTVPRGSAKKISSDGFGNVYIAGIYLDSTRLGPFLLNAGNAFVAKMDPNGNFLWARDIYRQGSWGAITTDKNGNTWISGDFIYNIGFGNNVSLTGGYGTPFFVKYDPNGNAQWAKSLNAGVFISNMVSNDNGSLFITGGYMGTVAFDTISVTTNYAYNLFIGRVNSAGQYCWVQSGQGAVTDGRLWAKTLNYDMYLVGAYAQGSGSMTIGNQTIYSTDPSNRQLFIGKFDSSGSCLSLTNFAHPCNGYAPDLNKLIWKNNAIYLAMYQCDAHLLKFQDLMTSLNQNKLNEGINLYPIPTQTEFTLEYSCEIEKAITIELFDGFGQAVFRKSLQINGTYSDKIDVSFLSRGLYCLRIIDSGGTHVRKVIVE